MLSLIALGLLMGARDVLDIWRKVACLFPSQREAIGLRVRDKQSGRLKMPGYDALNDLLAAVEPQAYAQALTSWLQANAGVLPRSLALDGKSVGNGRCGMIVTLFRHEDGRPVAMADGVPAEGYRYRMGLFYVDYETQKRTLKDSARWYRDLIQHRELQC